MIRLFVALEIPEPVKDKLIEIRKSLCYDEINFRWEPVEKLHITLKFIGDINEKFLDPIKSDLLFLENYKKLDGLIKKFGFFFRDGIPSILWASLELNPEVNEIVAELEDLFTKYRIHKEKRKFKPHLTLLRIKKDPGSDFINSFKAVNFEPLIFQSDKIILFQSELTKTGSKYYGLKTYHLN